MFALLHATLGRGNKADHPGEQRGRRVPAAARHKSTQEVCLAGKPTSCTCKSKKIDLRLVIMFKLPKTKTEMAVLPLLHLSMVECPYIPFSALPLKKKATSHPPRKRILALTFKKNRVWIGATQNKVSIEAKG